MVKLAAQRDVVGLIPAAGTARRLGDVAQSKEILPVVFGSKPSSRIDAARPACHHVLEGFVSAGVRKAIIVLREGKWDIPACLSTNAVPGIELSYTVVSDSPGVPWTLDRPYAFVSGLDVVLGFPDILIHPPSFFRQTLRELQTGNSDVVLGVMPTNTPSKVDVVTIGKDGRVNSILPKPSGLSTADAWVCAAWQPSFTEYLHEFLLRTRAPVAPESELYIGDVIAASIGELTVRAVSCDDGRFVDIGTPGDLAKVTPAR